MSGSTRGLPARLVGAALHSPSLPVPVTLTWVPLVLLLDRGAEVWFQRALGVGTWVLLAALLRRETPLVRAQVAVVVAFATAIEYTFSPLLEVYVYRLHNVPAFVPPGHGLVYLCALAIGRSAWVTARSRPLMTVTVVVAAAYAAWGLVWSPRLDVLGAFWFLCLLGFLRWGRSQMLYVGAFVVVTYLELLGTGLGTWAWQTHDPTGLVAIGNPPSGAAGGYGWFDLAAVLAGPLLLGLARRIRKQPGEAAVGRGLGKSASLPRGERRDDLVVQHAVCRDGAAAGRAVRSGQVGEPPARFGDDDRGRR
jgi:hypothetical protein